MASITLRTLGTKTSEIMRQVRQGEIFNVTYRGKVIASIIPREPLTGWELLQAQGAIQPPVKPIDWTKWEPASITPLKEGELSLSERLAQLRQDER